MKTKTSPLGADFPPKKTILLVDDDPSIRLMLGKVLGSEGYAVLTAPDGQSALELVSKATVDLVLLDLNMPIKNGWDTFERLSAENPMLAVIVITARPNQLFTALGAGVGGLLEKPLDFPTLLETVKRVLCEPVEQRLARIAGQQSEFHYHPAPVP